MRKSDDELYFEDDERAGRKRGKSNVAIVVMIVLIIGCIFVGVYTYVMKKATYNFWETTATYTNIPNASCLKTDDGYILYNCDGAEGHDGSGTTIWKISYNYSSPIAAACGKYAAVADYGTGAIHITDGSGTNYALNAPGKIIDVCISEQGVTAIRTDEGNTDHIYLYSSSGDMLLDIKTDVRKSGFPVTMAISPDGHKLVTSYIQVSDKQESWVTFYNFGDVGQNYVDKIVGSYSFEGLLIPDVRFMSGDRVLITGENLSVLYKFREVPEEISRKESLGGFASVASSSELFALAELESSQMRKITIYNKDGNTVSEIETGMTYDGMFIDTSELILASGDSCVIYRKDGKEKFRAGLNGTIRLMFLSGTDSSYTIIEENFTELIKLTSKTEQNQGFSGLE